MAFVVSLTACVFGGELLGRGVGSVGGGDLGGVEIAAGQCGPRRVRRVRRVGLGARTALGKVELIQVPVAVCWAWLGSIA